MDRLRGNRLRRNADGVLQTLFADERLARSQLFTRRPFYNRHQTSLSGLMVFARRKNQRLFLPLPVRKYGFCSRGNFALFMISIDILWAMSA
jgi:hypothetical protein